MGRTVLTPPEARCVRCGTPIVDHLALRYFLRAWTAHHFWTLLDQLAAAKRRRAHHQHRVT